MRSREVQRDRGTLRLEAGEVGDKAGQHAAYDLGVLL